jgi:hypothetical protein
MEDFFDFVSTSQGMALVNAIGCAIFLAQIWVSLAKQRIDLGSIPPKIQRSKNPRAYWSVIFLNSAIVVWTGVAAAMNFFGS